MVSTAEGIGEIRHPIAVERLEEYLKRSSSRVEPPLRVLQFSYGQSNPTYMVKDSRGHEYVLRKKPAGALLSSTAHAVEREFRVLKALEGTPFPAPRVFELCQTSDVLDTPFYIMEFLRGRIMQDATLPDLERSDRTAAWTEAIDVLARLHQVDYRAVGLSTFGKSKDFFPRQLRTLSRISEAQARTKNTRTGAEVGPIPHFAEIVAWLGANLPPDMATIVHGDYKLDNLIFAPDSLRVIGVIDWELSTIGHPLSKSDLGNLCMPFFSATIMHSTMPLDVEKDLLSQLLQRYERATGFNPAPHWKFARVFAEFRLAVIVQGIAARLATGQASSAKAESHASMVYPLGESIFAMIRKESKL